MKSFAEVFPTLVSSWSNSNTLRPDQVSYGSNKPIVWNGECGHTWTATPKNRGHGHGCPYCSTNKILVGFNDLASQYPNIAKEWSERNYPATPKGYGAHSNQSFWWKCSKCSREWQARIADRTEGHGCPYCLKDAITDRIERRKAAHKQEVMLRLRQRRFARSLKDESFRWESLSYYAEKTGHQVEFDYDPGIGIPVQMYFPEKCAAIELTSYLNEGWMDWRYENAKNWLCLNSGIKLIRIIPQTGYKFENCKCVRVKNGTADALNYALTQAFKKLKIPMDIDVSRDFEKIRRLNYEKD